MNGIPGLLISSRWRLIEMKWIDFKDAIILYLAKRYGRFENKANEIVKKYGLTEEDVERIVRFMGG